MAGQADLPAAARFDQALRWAQEGRESEAQALLEALVHEHPQHPEPRINLAVLLARQGRLTEARQQLDAALRSQPAAAHAYDQLLTLHAHMARDAYARAALTAATPGASGIALAPLTRWEGSAAAASGPAAVAAMPALAPPPQPGATTAATPAATGPSVPVSGSPGSPGNPGSSDNAGGGSRVVIGALLLALLLLLGAGTAWAARQRNRAAAESDNPPTQPAAALAGEVAPEERLIGIYRLIGEARLPEALAAAEALTRDEPQFQLGQLVRGDLLLALDGRLAEVAQPGAATGVTAPTNAAALREEARRRLQALRDEPPPGLVPRQLIQLPSSVQHAVAIDASRSRLHIFENRDGRLQRRSSHYVALGSQGVGKREEGDQRTPLGVYHITSRLDGRQLGDFYGPGALPLNYPNEHDRRQGRTGANIWLHGTPSAQYARAPRSTNGCVVLANDDMRRLLRELKPRHTPVVIAEQLEWLSPQALQVERQAARTLVDSWRQARAAADLRRLGALYAQHFDNGEAGVDGWRQRLGVELMRFGAREREVIDLTVLGWNEKGEHLIVDFTEVTPGSGLRPQRRRQYWARESGQWKIFSEGVFE